jgi:Tfp pilus assembly protein FimV
LAGNKISLELHIDNSEAEALVRDLAQQVRKFRAELNANAAALQAMIAEAQAKLLMIGELHVAAEEHAHDAEATLAKIDAAFAKWSEQRAAPFLCMGQHEAM